MNDKKNSGFTLIELLVVIAIIGILAALVLVALGNARDKAQDARVKSSVSQLRTLAEVLYDNVTPSSYVNVASCFNSGANCGGGTVATNVASLQADILSANGQATWSSVGSAASGYCISEKLKSDNTKFFCVDGAGNAKITTASCASPTAVACP